MKITTETEGGKCYRVVMDSEAYEFNEDLIEIDYYMFSERFHTWVLVPSVQLKKDYPVSFDELKSALSYALEDYFEDQKLIRPCEMTAFKEKREL